ncbi:VOC family protein [Cucumibacter marinus]|uniref:VOC family protein n=1 Tax=Cucumibacter marinus TaxID=1121252 RepID=UPI0003F92ADF|nr:VOC family protein [Cucumibacter marinus]
MPRVVHFEIHCDDPARARRFYGELFGWEFAEIMPDTYWTVKTGEKGEPGIDGGLLKRVGEQSGNIIMAFVCTIEVDDLDATIARAEALGATPAVPKQAIPGVGWQYFAKDTEGNVFGIHQADPGAA